MIAIPHPYPEAFAGSCRLAFARKFSRSSVVWQPRMRTEALFFARGENGIYFTRKIPLSRKAPGMYGGRMQRRGRAWESWSGYVLGERFQWYAWRNVRARYPQCVVIVCYVLLRSCGRCYAPASQSCPRRDAYVLSCNFTISYAQKKAGIKHDEYEPAANSSTSLAETPRLYSQRARFRWFRAITHRISLNA